MRALQFSNTPTVAVLDNRGLTVRELTCHRHPDAPDVTTPLITRHTFSTRGFPVRSADPRLHDAGLANFSYLTDLNGDVLRSDGADNGTTVQLSDAAGRPLLTVTADGVVQRVQYESAELPGRPLSVTGQTPDGRTHITDRFVYAGSSAAEKGLNLAGTCTRRYDTAGLLQTDSISLTGTPLSVTRRLLKDGDNPETVADWQGADASAWNDLLDAEGFITLTLPDATGAVLATTDAAGHQQRMACDVAGQLKRSWLTVKGGREQVILASVSYSAAGQKVREEHGNGVVTTYTYEPETQRLTGIKTERPAGHAVSAKVLQDLRYGYDPVGNVLSVRNDAEETRFWRNQKVVPENTYVYDSLYRLVSATGREMAGSGQQSPALPGVTSFDSATYTNYTRRYEYDAGGNLTRIRHSAPATGNSYTTDITISDRSNRGVLSTLTEKPSGVDTLFTAGGRQTRLLPGQTLSWTSRDELQAVRPVVRDGSADDRESYRYDSDSQRVLKLSVQKTGGSTQTQRTLYLPGLELRTTTSGTTEAERLQVVTAGEAGNAQVRVLVWTKGMPAGLSNGQVRCSHDTLTGSSGLETDGDGSVISREEYYPYGGTSVLTGRSAVEAEYRTVRYSGKERDATGLYYYGYRYYQPWSGRWLSADPAGTVDGLNLFRMCRNNPVTFFDTDGRMLRRKISTMSVNARPQPSSVPSNNAHSVTNRIDMSTVSITQREIIAHGRHLSEGEYPNNLIRHNFTHGNENYPEPDNLPGDYSFEDPDTDDEKKRSGATGKFLATVNRLPDEPLTEPLYRGTNVPDDLYETMEEGGILQSHQLSFFSNHKEFASTYAASSSSRGKPVLFKLIPNPRQTLKRGLVSPMAYDIARSELKKLRVKPSKINALGGDKTKETIAQPGTLYEIKKIDKKYKSKLHRDVITKVTIAAIGHSDKVYEHPLR